KLYELPSLLLISLSNSHNLRLLSSLLKDIIFSYLLLLYFGLGFRYLISKVTSKLTKKSTISEGNGLTLAYINFCQLVLTPLSKLSNMILMYFSRSFWFFMDY